MIPASYLYKDAYRQHWGEDFARVSGEEPWEAHLDAGQWPAPSLFGKLVALLSRSSGDASASASVCPDAMTQRYA